MSAWLPACRYGYTTDDLHAVLGDRYDEFGDWMRGQTATICDGREYDYDAHEYRETGCGPHGGVIYSWDVERFLAGLPVID